jgi:hypothetical protein
MDPYRRSWDILHSLLYEAQLVFLYPNMDTWLCFRNKHVIHIALSLN